MTSPVDDFLDGYRPPVGEVVICGDAALIADHARVEAELLGHSVHASLGGPPKELVGQLAELEARIEASALVVKFQALAHRPWVDLLAAHPPSPEERAKGFGTHPATFEPAAVAACAVEPEMTVAQAERMRETLPRSEWEALTTAVRDLHEERSSAPKSRLLSALRPANAASSATPQDEGSLGEPSSGDSGGQ